ncbi:hypothetical protein N431DRAFT_527494 [Stipitochalara longipes BDJ]|nr:hypothetical protein N431DRAFT_527494 [Stipitochalara longipes BDJ]
MPFHGSSAQDTTKAKTENHILFKSTISIALFATLVYSQAKDLNPGGVSCVDPSGYTSYYATSASKFTGCGEAYINQYSQGNTNFEDCINGCSAMNWATNIGCWLQTCWNQTTMKNPIPYYPTPEGVPGACSCNLGQVYGNITDLSIADIPVCADIAPGLVGGTAIGASETFDCNCCRTGQLLSNVFNICPNSNLSSIGFDKFFAIEEKDITNAQQSFSENAKTQLGNCTILDTAPDTCALKYKLPIEGTKWWNPLDLPSGVPGTQALSDIPGSVTVPPWGASTSSMVLFPSYTTIITPAPYNAKNATATTALAGTAIGSKGAAATTKANAGNANMTWK